MTLLASTQTSTGAQLIFFADRHKHLHEFRWTQTTRDRWRHFDLTDVHALPLIQLSAGVCLCDATTAVGQMVVLYFVDQERELHELRQLAVPLPGTPSKKKQVQRGDGVSIEVNPWFHATFGGDEREHTLPAISRLCSAQVLPISRSVNATVLYFLDSGTHHLQELTLKWRFTTAQPSDNETTTGMEVLYEPHLTDLTSDVPDFPLPSDAGVSVYSRGVVQAFTAQASVLAKRAWGYLRLIPGIGADDSGQPASSSSSSSGELNGGVNNEESDSDGSDDGESAEVLSHLGSVSTRSSHHKPLVRPTDPNVYLHRDVSSVDSPQVQKEVMLTQKYTHALGRWREQVGVNDRLRAVIVKLEKEHQAAESDSQRQGEITSELQDIRARLEESEQLMRERQADLDRERKAREEQAAEIEAAHRKEDELQRAEHEKALQELSAAQEEAQGKLAREQARLKDLERENEDIKGQHDDEVAAKNEAIEAQRALVAQVKDLNEKIALLAGGMDVETAIKVRQHGLSEIKDECVICLEEVSEGDTELECGHSVMICSDCLPTLAKCPSCDHELSIRG
jgi:hypothetical protein